jgi:hypothetical protein
MIFDEMLLNYSVVTKKYQQANNGRLLLFHASSPLRCKSGTAEREIDPEPRTRTQTFD